MITMVNNLTELVSVALLVVLIVLAFLSASLVHRLTIYELTTYAIHPVLMTPILNYLAEPVSAVLQVVHLVPTSLTVFPASMGLH